MNTTDMYTREKAAHDRQAEIERHIRATALLAKEQPAGTALGRGWAVAAGGAALAALLIALGVFALVVYGGVNLLV